jgi:DNA-binding NarL/FixJ family response regulator
MDKPYHILIIDDHTLFADGLQNIIVKNNLGIISGIVNNGKDLLCKLNSFVPDLIILDINMPILNGIEATKIILVKYPNIKILIISMREEIKTIKELKALGISGYLTKFIGESDLIEAIENIKNNIPYFPVLDDYNKIILNKKEGFINLTNSEIKVIHLVVDGFTSKEIAEQLNLSLHTVNTHRKNISRKTSLKNTVALIDFVKEKGL